MNQRFDPNDKRSNTPGSWPADKAAADAGAPRTAPLGTSAASDPTLNSRPLDPDAPIARPRSNWPILIILLAGLIVALLLWMPGGNTGNDTATQPAAPASQATPPADQATPPAAGTTSNDTTAPAGNTTATPPATTTPSAATPPAATGTDSGAPATGTGSTGTETPATGSGTTAPTTAP